MKKCNKCNEIKPLDNFSKLSSSRDKVNYFCKICDSTRNMIYRNENIEKEKNRHRKKKQIKTVPYNKEKVRAYNKKWTLSNPARNNAKNAKYRALKKMATPEWLNKSHYEEMEIFYIKAKELELITKIKYHVDHIVPLSNCNVCGLHVPWNLQVITAEENMKKNNRITT
jgi:hypothetical protein